MKCRTFNAKAKASFQKRYESLGRKWELLSGKFVEDLLFDIGMTCEYYNPVHSFMIDCDDKWLASKFAAEEWKEICEGWPEATISAGTSGYIESFADVDTLVGLEKALCVRPEGLEERLVHRCLEDGLFIYSDDPSPFLIAERLSEAFWQREAWGVASKLAMGHVNCKMLPGDMAGVESKERQNRIQANKGPSNGRARIGKKGDLFWRSFDEPQRDWAVVEAAKAWNAYKDKYIIESTTKLPRQLHDILIHRTRELGNVDPLRTIAVPGLVMGGPVIQLLCLCWGCGGVNVTRFKRGEAGRLESSVDMLGMSLSAIYTLLTFRATVSNLMERYHLERKKTQRKARLQRFGVKLLAESEGELPLDLLHSSP
ncbi:hypothetical protein EMPS_11590 [Entomortierella parvispora]|uniref:Uncharacterized protein n=1 Tax=Entomortierella parvispora TaxID=205924 RepID=A0A9P3HM05_9FUNG|nr:hypothetical protein EMPS_11590 [Entomortierella parvispora]